ncbi:MAG: thiamine phosphate synthase [Nitratireductor sp.]
MSHLIDPFYPIVENAKWVERIVPLGVKTIQLRHKGDAKDIEQEVINAQSICAKYNCELILNDHWQMAIDLKCGFIHLGQEDLELADMKAIKQANIKYGISTHSQEELEIALALKPDYIALGPIFGTTSKELSWQAQGLGKIRDWKKQIGDIPLITIGGITLSKAGSVFDAGADSIAVISDITKSQTPEQQVQNWLDLSTKQ